MKISKRLEIYYARPQHWKEWLLFSNYRRWCGCREHVWSAFTVLLQGKDCPYR